ncbi:MAG TPA: hypothetical protein ENJ93_07165 [Chloroflexi bacterium]|nr:hypothetical protein [Chloroflexota bacterium]
MAIRPLPAFSTPFCWLPDMPKQKSIRNGRKIKKSIVAVALLNTFTYLLVLVALSVSKATYVGALRQLSLVAGVFLGWRFLQESLPGPKIISVVLLITGSALIAFAR